MKRSKKIFFLAFILFLIFLILIIVEVSHKTTFPGKKKKMVDSVKIDSLGI